MEPTKREKIERGMNRWVSFYRANPHRFAIDYFGMKWLAPFQQQLLDEICENTYSMVIASRGMGKSMIVAAAICVKCVLYPGLIVTVAAGVRSQSTNLLGKIADKFMPDSPNLRNEIAICKVTPSEAFIRFKNGSVVRVVTARDSARSERTNWMIADEFVQIKKDTLDSVLRKFKAGERTPPFFANPKYKNYPKERNCETYISSAYFKWHYSWAKFQSYFKSMVKGAPYFVCGFPYQLPVSAGYYPLAQIQEEMQEEDFNAIKFEMEMNSRFWGESEKSFFSYVDINSARKLTQPIYPRPLYQALGDPKMKYPAKEPNEIRLLSADIATAGGAKNDATAISLLQLLPTLSGQYIRNLVYMETIEGGHGQDQAIRIRQLYDDLDADFVVIDSNGVGVAIYDQLVQDLYDEERGTVYRAWSCVNDESMAMRSRNPNAPRIIYSIKASQSKNSEMAVALRDCLRRDKLRLLINETDGSELLEKSKAYRNLSPEDQVVYQHPYYQTTAFANETINLEYEMSGQNNIRIYEVAGMRKDRYSSVSYANYIASELERDLRRRSTDEFKYAPRCVSTVEF